MQSILAVSWPALSAAPARVEQLHERLNVPRAWTAQAAAWWAAATRDAAGEVTALMGAGLSQLAEAKLFDSVAPAALRRKDVEGLSALVGLWAPQTGTPVALLQVRAPDLCCGVTAAVHNHSRPVTTPAAA